MKIKLIVITFGWMMAVEASAALRLPPLFADNMILQADRPLKVWGVADPGKQIMVTVAGQSGTTQSDAEGKWSVTLNPLQAGAPGELKVEGDGVLSFTGVLAGEVWLCSGQSNMALPVSKAKDAKEEIAAANWPQIRTFQKGKWITCSPQTAGAFSATAYYFGREIHRKTGRPVALIDASSGGTPIELWTSPEAQKAVPALAPLFAGEAIAQAGAADAQQAENDRQQAVEVEGKQAVAAQKKSPGYLFQDRILPLAPFALQGVIWYQGEANSYTAHANLYGIQLETMIKDWRSRWGYDFAFISVQLPEFGSPQTEPVQTHGRVLVREGVLKSLELPNVGMAVTLGTGEEKSNHPMDKQEAGRRLAQWALAKVYGQKEVAASGPIPSGNRVDGNRVILSFSNTDGGLVARGGEPLKGFAIAAADGKWVWGEAKIEGETVVVSSPEIKEPVAVRYAWAIHPVGCNLANGAGLPATPFRTDNEVLANKAGQ